MDQTIIMEGLTTQDTMVRVVDHNLPHNQVGEPPTPPTEPKEPGRQLPGLVEHLIHDLTQPLSAIGNLACACRSLADEGASDREARVSAYSQKITDQVMRAGEMVAVMRSLMRRMVAGVSPEQLDKLIRDALWMVGVSFWAAMGRFRAPAKRLFTARRSCNGFCGGSLGH